MNTNASIGFLSLAHVKNARESLKDAGYLLIENAVSRGKCDEFVRWMDSCAGHKDLEVNYAGTEVRIWDAHKRFGSASDFLRQCDVFLSCMQKSDMEAFTLLAIRNYPVDPSNLDVQMGRWHIDSFRSQYKIFLFLSDVTEASGPFEFVPRTHHFTFRAANALRGKYFQPLDFMRKSRRYMHLDDQWISRLTRRKPPRAVTCAAGTVMVINTSAIHRARPCLAGARYALTAYYR